MGLITSIALILCGILATSSLIVAKKPNAKELIDKLTPIQGWLGVVVCIIGIWTLIQILLHLNIYLHVLDWFIVALAISLLEICLGFLLGYSLINQVALSKNPEAAAKGEAFRAKLTAYQIPLGVAGIVLGLIGVIEVLRLGMH